MWKPTSCASTGWTCIGNINTAGQYGSMSLTAGTTYYILLDDENSTIGTHTFYINAVDNIAPTTLINVVGNWQTQNFTTTYTDADNTGGSGVDMHYYQVLDYNGMEWRGNESNGFYNDNFSTSLIPSWTVVDTSWHLISGHLEQTSTTSGNTNIYTAVAQDSTHTFLYHWQMMFNPGSNRRAGIYIYCSDPTQTQRGNAYMIWFRADDDKCQLYTVKNNTISTNLTDDNCTINDGVWYDCKATYNPATGVLKAYLNDNLASSYTDLSLIHI